MYGSPPASTAHCCATGCSPSTACWCASAATRSAAPAASSGSWCVRRPMSSVWCRRWSRCSTAGPCTPRARAPGAPSDARPGAGRPPGVPAPDLPQAVERPPSAVPQAVERPPAARGLVPAAALAPEPAVPPQQPQPVCPDAAGPPAQAARTGLVRAMTAGYTSGTAAIDRLVSGA
ncbi:hypothetical protein ACFQ60_37505 [Streptomyces zhihengii]